MKILLRIFFSFCLAYFFIQIPIKNRRFLNLKKMRSEHKHIPRLQIQMTYQFFNKRKILIFSEHNIKKKTSIEDKTDGIFS